MVGQFGQRPIFDLLDKSPKRWFSEVKSQKSPAADNIKSFYGDQHMYIIVKINKHITYKVK